MSLIHGEGFLCACQIFYFPNFSSLIWRSKIQKTDMQCWKHKLHICLINESAVHSNVVLPSREKSKALQKESRSQKVFKPYEKSKLNSFQNHIKIVSTDFFDFFFFNKKEVLHSFFWNFREESQLLYWPRKIFIKSSFPLGVLFSQKTLFSKCQLTMTIGNTAFC